MTPKLTASAARNPCIDTLPDDYRAWAQVPRPGFAA
jgi:hypothetical protein